MDGAQGQLNLIITDESLEEDDRRNITTNKHSAARTAVEQGADANPCFKVLKFLCKFCDILLDIGTECHGLKRRLTNEIMGLNTESNSRSLEKPEQTGHCVCLQKNIGGVHNIFTDNTKKFLLDRDDIPNANSFEGNLGCSNSPNVIQEWSTEMDRRRRPNHSGKTPFFWEQLERREPNPRTHWESNSKSLDQPEQTGRCVCLQKKHWRRT